MWRAFVLALTALAVCQVFSPTPALADKGGWVLTGSHGGLNVAYADLNQDCVIDVLDEQASAFRYGATWPFYLYDNYYDVEPQGGKYDYPPPGSTGDDWDIDIKDLQFVFGRDGMNCTMFWDPETLMGMYSYKSSTPTGPGTSCYPTAQNPPGSAYVDPITVVLTGNATDNRVRTELTTRGLPYIETDSEQRFWEVGRCSFEDVDAGENEGGCNPSGDPVWCPVFDVWERMHARCEEADQEGQAWEDHWNRPSLGRYSVCTPHFDDDENTCGHFVPEIFPYPERIYPGFVGSGFDAGREWLRIQFGGSYTVEDWANRVRIHQGCGDDQDPRSNGWVVFKAIN